jgi:RNA recognition motif-containing protein
MQGSKLYVGNFSYSVTDEQLEQLFAEYGTVVSASVIVERSSAEEAEKAKEALDGTDFSGRSIKVNEALPQKSRPERNFKRY